MSGCRCGGGNSGKFSFVCVYFLNENRKQVHGGEQDEQGMLEVWGERSWYESFFKD